MKSNETTYQFINSEDHNKINRRTFFTKSFGYTAGITLLAFPGIIPRVLAEKAEKSKEEVFKELGLTTTQAITLSTILRLLQARHLPALPTLPR